MSSEASNAPSRAGLGHMIRFGFTGIVNALVGYSIYAGLVLAGLLPALALPVSFCLGVLWNYFTHVRFVFRGSGGRRLLPYIGCYVALLAVNSVLLETGLSLGIGPLVTQAILTPVMAALSFVFIARVLTGHFPMLRPRKN